jgi:hypothetical protein
MHTNAATKKVRQPSRNNTPICGCTASLTRVTPSWVMMLSVPARHGSAIVCHDGTTPRCAMMTCGELQRRWQTHPAHSVHAAGEGGSAGGWDDTCAPAGNCLAHRMLHNWTRLAVWCLQRHTHSPRVRQNCKQPHQLRASLATAPTISHQPQVWGWYRQPQPQAHALLLIHTRHLTSNGVPMAVPAKPSILTTPLSPS